METTHRQQTEERAAKMLALSLDVSPAAAVALYQADPAGVLTRTAEAFRAIDPNSPTARDCDTLREELAAKSPPAH